VEGGEHRFNRVRDASGAVYHETPSLIKLGVRFEPKEATLGLVRKISLRLNAPGHRMRGFPLQESPLHPSSSGPSGPHMNAVTTHSAVSSVLEISSEPAFTCDVTGCVLCANGPAVALLARSGGSIVGHPIRDLLGQEAHEAVLRALAQSLDGPLTVTLPPLRSDVATSPLTLAVRGLGDMAACFLRHTRAGESHNEAYERLSLLAELADNLVSGMVYQIVRYPEGRRRFTYLGAAVSRLYGITPEQGMADSSLVYGRVHRDDSDRLVAEEEAALETMSVFRCEARVFNPDGSLRWSSWVSVPTLLCDGSVRWDGVEFDVTERRRLIDELSQYKSMLDLSPSGAAIFDRAGYIVYANEAFASAHGYIIDDLTGKHFSILHAPEQLAEVQRLTAKLLQDGVLGITEVAHVRRDGKPFTMLTVGNVISDPSGRPRWVTCTAMDVSDRKALEMQLHRARRLESVGRLAGGLAHDFNNVVSVVMGQAELASGLADDPDAVKEAMAEIMVVAEKAASLTRQLLTFASRTPSSPEPVDLNRVVEGMLSILKRLIGEQVSLDWLPGAGPSLAAVDPGQVDQILANLCLNARDSIAGAGRITIETGEAVFDEAWCSTHSGFRTGEYVWISVSDNGSGMDADTQAQIFEPFFTTKEAGKGTGLGLSTVHGIVSQHGGFVKVYSELGMGTAFKIFFPRYGAPVSLAEAVEAEMAPLHAASVLLVEDEPAILTMARTMLENAGFMVAAAQSPSEALGLAAELAFCPDVVVSDLVMPGLNGSELAWELRRLFPALKVVFISGYSPGAAAQHVHVDFSDAVFLQKPFYAKDLVAAVHKALRG